MKKDAILNDVFAATGTAAALGALLGISRSAVSQWQKVPLRYLKQVSELTGIPRRKLRPDLYDDEDGDPEGCSTAVRVGVRHD